jgi:elongation factor G
MDKERANYDTVINNLKTNLKVKTASLCIPYGQGADFKGLVDIIAMKLVVPHGDGKKADIVDIPPELKELAGMERSNLIELAAEGDDELIEKFLSGEELSEEEAERGLDEQLLEARLSSVMCGSTSKVIGLNKLLRVIKNYVPSPMIKTEYKGHAVDDESKEIIIKSREGEPFSAIVWKTSIDQYAGRFNYIKVTSGELTQDREIYNSTKKCKERVAKIYTMIGNKLVDVQKLNCGDIGVLVKLDRTSTGDTLCDPKREVIIPLIQLPHPVFSYAIEAKNKADEDKLGQFLHRVVDENPTITFSFNAETHESVLSGMGEMQLDIILNGIKERSKIEIVKRTPRVAYRETITKKAEAQYKHKKQSGGHGQYGEVHLRLAPRKRGEGYEFIDSIVGGVVPKQYIPGVQKGIIEALDEGILARYPVVDVSAELFYGSYHDVDSSEMAFKIAARSAFKLAMEAAAPQLLEPVMEVAIFVDKDMVGDILNDTTSRRGRVLGMENAEGEGGVSVVKATIPLAEMLRYTIDLRAMTSGKATFEMKFSHYDPISGKIAEKVIEERKKYFEAEAAK